jgi:hypothetical protein
MTVRPTVYVAHPMASYGTPHAAACLVDLGALLPGARLIDPAAIYGSDAEWQRGWPRLVRRLWGFVIFGAEDGTIGAGCIRELADAVAFGVPITGFDVRIGLREILGVDLLDMDSRSARRTGTLRLGRCVSYAGDGERVSRAPSRFVR